MKKIIASVLVLCGLFILNAPAVHAFSEDEISKAAEVAQAFVEVDGYLIDPQSHVPYFFGIDDLKGKNFDELASTATIMAFNIVDQGKPSGTVWVENIQNGNFVVNSSEYGGWGVLYNIDRSTIDGAIVFNEIGNEYYCIKDGEEEYVVPGLFRFGDNTSFRSGRTKCSTKEFVNATKYRNRFDPIDGRLMGDRSAQTAFHYIGMMEQLRTNIIMGVSVSIVLIATIVIVLIIRKKTNNETGLALHKSE